jgi:hypothetical protein
VRFNRLVETYKGQATPDPKWPNFIGPKDREKRGRKRTTPLQPGESEFVGPKKYRKARKITDPLKRHAQQQNQKAEDEIVAESPFRDFNRLVTQQLQEVKSGRFIIPHLNSYTGIVLITFPEGVRQHFINKIVADVDPCQDGWGWHDQMTEDQPWRTGKANVLEVAEMAIAELLNLYVRLAPWNPTYKDIDHPALNSKNIARILAHYQAIRDRPIRAAKIANQDNPGIDVEV